MAFFSSKPKDESKSNGKNLKLFSERGFGLIEAVVGMVLVALVGVAAMKTVESLSRNAKVAGAGAELGVLRAQVLTLLSANSQTCIASLKDSAGQVAKFNPDVVLPPNPTPAQIANYRAVNSLSQIELAGLVIAKPGEKSGGLFVRDLILRELEASLRQNTTVAGVSARRFISVLDISLSLEADPTRPTLARGIRLPVILEADSATHALLSCAFGGSEMRAEAPPPSGVITTPAGPFQSEIVCNNVEGTNWSIVFRFHALNHVSTGNTIRYRDSTGNRWIDFNADGSYRGGEKTGSCANQNIKNLNSTTN